MMILNPLHLSCAMSPTAIFHYFFILRYRQWLSCRSTSPLLCLWAPVDHHSHHNHHHHHQNHCLIVWHTHIQLTSSVHQQIVLVHANQPINSLFISFYLSLTTLFLWEHLSSHLIQLTFSACRGDCWSNCGDHFHNLAALLISSCQLISRQSNLRRWRTSQDGCWMMRQLHLFSARNNHLLRLAPRTARGWLLQASLSWLWIVLLIVGAAALSLLSLSLTMYFVVLSLLSISVSLSLTTAPLGFSAAMSEQRTPSLDQHLDHDYSGLFVMMLEQDHQMISWSASIDSMVN